MKYLDLAMTLKENEEILEGIRRHALGGSAPKIIGMTGEARRLMGTQKGRSVSIEFVKATRKQYSDLQKLREVEAKSGKKRPKEHLFNHVTATSQLIAAYVSRFQWMAEQG